MKATFNGQDILDVPTGGTIRGTVDERVEHLVLELDRDGQTVWVGSPLALRPEPTRRFSTSRSADYSALCWPEASAAAVLGYPAAAIVDLASGRAVSWLALEFTGKESLDQAGLDITKDGQLLVITSTKRLWVVDQNLEPVLRYEPRFILAGLPALVDHTITVPEYDFDGDEERVTRVLEL